jgi:hypothetical protein
MTASNKIIIAEGPLPQTLIIVVRMTNVVIVVEKILALITEITPTIVTMRKLCITKKLITYYRHIIVLLLNITFLTTIQLMMLIFDAGKTEENGGPTF